MGKNGLLVVPGDGRQGAMLGQNKTVRFIEIALVAAVFVVIILSAWNTFTDSSEDASVAARDQAVRAVQQAIAAQKADDLVKNGPPGRYPPFLDQRDAMAAGGAYPLFDSVLAPGIVDSRWVKSSLGPPAQYTFTSPAGDRFVYTYNSEKGTFLAPFASY